jgi:ribosomal protein L37AE/L43A
MATGNSSGLRLYPDLSEIERRAYSRGECPDCRCRNKWQAGPCGGMCQNWRCGNCGSRFNQGAGYFVERISQPKPGIGVIGGALS